MSGFGLRVSGVGGPAVLVVEAGGGGERYFDVPALHRLIQVSDFRVQGSGFRVQGSGFRAPGSGFRVQGSRIGIKV